MKIIIIFLNYSFPLYKIHSLYTRFFHLFTFYSFIHYLFPIYTFLALYRIFIPFIHYSFHLSNIHSLNPTLIPFIRYSAEPIGPIFCVGPHMTPGKVYGSSKYEKNSWKIVGFFLKMRHFGKKIRQIWKNGRLSMRQLKELKSKIIYRKGGGKRPKSLCIVYIWINS